MRRVIVRVCVAWFVLAGSLVRAGGDNDWTVDDVVLGQTTSGLAVSPDGVWGAWSQSEVITLDGDETEISSIHLAHLEEAADRRLTRGASSAWSARFSPDSASIAFLSDRGHPTDPDAASTQVWVIPVDGGEAECVTALPRDIQQFEWSGDGSIIVLAPDGKTNRETTLEDAKDTTIVVENPDDEPRTRLFRVDPDTGETRRVTENTGWIQSFALSPDGARAVVIESTSLSSEFDEKIKPRLMLVDLADGSMRELMGETPRAYAAVNWDPDGRGFYFEYLHSTHEMYRAAGVSRLEFYEFATGRTTVLNEGIDKGYIVDIDAFRGGVYFACEFGARTLLARFQWSETGGQTGLVRLLQRGAVQEIACSPEGDGPLLVATSSAITPGTISAARLSIEAAAKPEYASLTPIASMNEDWADRDFGRVETISWEGARGERVEGVLHYPLGYEEGRKYPLILAPHGGPLGASLDEWSLRWSYPIMLWRQRGAFVLEPNYHGSSAYGIEFAESIGNGNYLTIDVEDCEKGVDHVLDLGLADPDRLAVVGWSNGAILGAALITRSTRWTAASIGAGDVEFISDWGNVDFGASFDNYYMGGPPWEQLERYIDRAAFFKLDRVTTPTIVFTGTEDRNVPPSQSWSLFRALQQIGKAPTRLVLFPGEPHGLQEIAHRRRKVTEELAWLDRYLFNTAEPANDALADASPLAALLEKNSAAGDDGWFGLTVGGVFTPEFVDFDGLRVSRFEITNGQWLSFEPDHDFASQRANAPVTGMTFDRARAYADWLAGVLQRPVRLMTEAEADELADAAGAWGGGGNTLDAWAGYAVTPDDRERLAPVIAPLQPGALLMSVGSMSGAGEKGAMVFDLDGNAAEWATDEHGEGIVTGPSADRPGDAGDRRPTTDPAYIGLRVVIGP